MPSNMLETVNEYHSREPICIFEDNKLLPEEQKGCRKVSRGTNDLLYIDQRMMKEAKQRERILQWRG